MKQILTAINVHCSTMKYIGKYGNYI